MKKNKLVLLVFTLLLGVFSFYGCKRKTPKPIPTPVPTPSDKTFAITWKNYDGSVLKTELFKLNETPKYEGTPKRADTEEFTYEFIGWDKEIEQVKSDTVYIAKYKPSKRLYTITWKTEDGHILQTEKLEYGVAPKFNGSNEGITTDEFFYKFIGWDRSFEPVKSDTTYTALYEKTKRKYKITWKTTNDKILKTEELEYGVMPKYNDEVVHDLEETEDYFYEFTGWDKEINQVKSNTTYVAQFEKKLTELGLIKKDKELEKMFEFSFYTADETSYSIKKIKDYEYKDLIIPNEYKRKPIRNIGDSAFAYCSSLSSLTIPNSVTSIGIYAFRDCSALSSLTIPNSVTSIGESAFKGCSSLSSLTIPNSVTSISIYAFRDCSALSSLTIPNSVTSIGGGAFQHCTSLSSLTIPNSVTSIGRYAFKGCTSLSSLTIPNSVTSIGGYAFNDGDIYCENIEKPTTWDRNWCGIRCKVYWYSEIPNTDGNHWHYVDGKPTVWK